MLRVSFYSYKGGSGRSTTAWNTIQQLAKIMEPTKDAPFVIVDTDTQSAGATFLFQGNGSFDEETSLFSVQKRMCEEPEDYSGDSKVKEKFFGTMLAVGSHFGMQGIDTEAVRLIGANLDANSKTARSVEVMGKEGDEKKNSLGKNFRKGIVSACRRCGAKALFFDTPSGSQFLARLSVQSSDVVVCCMRPTSQFRTGTFGQLKQFLDNDKAAERPRKYIITPTAVCVDKEQLFSEQEYPRAGYDEIVKHINVLGKELEEEFRKNVVLDMVNLDKQTVCQDSVEDIFGIPEVKRFKWDEKCLGTLPEDSLSPNDKMAIERYEKLAKTIIKYAIEEKKDD